MEEESKVDSENMTDLQANHKSQLKQGHKVRIIDGEFVNKEGVLISDCEDGTYCVNISGFEFPLVVIIEKSALIPFEEDTKH